MSCKDPCSQTGVGPVGIYPVVDASTPGSVGCLSTGFCDPKLEGLPRRSKLDLVGVPHGGKCLVRPAYGPGLWQHDPLGGDYVGPLARLEVLAGEKAEFGHIALLVPEFKDYGHGLVPITTVRPVDLGEVADGSLAVIRQQVCADGTRLERFDRLAPEDFPAETPDNFYQLGMVETADKCGNTSYPTHRFYKSPHPQFPFAQIPAYTGVDLEDTDVWRMAVWRREGDRYNLGTMPVPTFVTECGDLPESGAVANALTVCRGGVAKILLPNSGEDAVGAENQLIGRGNLWNRKPRGLGFFPLDSPFVVVSKVFPTVLISESITVNLPAEVQALFTGGKFWALLHATFQAASIPGSSLASGSVDVNGMEIIYVGSTGGAGQASTVTVPLSGTSITVDMIPQVGVLHYEMVIEIIGFFA